MLVLRNLYLFYCFQLPIYAAYLYDAAFQFAVALNRTENSANSDGRKIVQKLMGQHFHSKLKYYYLPYSLRTDVGVGGRLRIPHS